MQFIVRRRANEGDVEQVWRGSRLGEISANSTGLIKQIHDRCGGKIRLVRSTGRQEEKTRHWKRAKDTTNT